MSGTSSKRGSLDYSNWQWPKFVPETKTDSRPSSVYYEEANLDVNEFKTEFVFLNWIGYAPDRLESYTVVSNTPHHYANYKIILKYVNSGLKRVVIQFILPDKTKYMSYATYSSYDIFDVIDSMLNNQKQSNPIGHEPRRYQVLTPDEWEKSVNSVTFVKWGLIKTESLIAPSYTITADYTEMLPVWLPNYASFR